MSKIEYDPCYSLWKFMNTEPEINVSGKITPCSETMVKTWKYASFVQEFSCMKVG